jgi:hypothetical protein
MPLNRAAFYAAARTTPFGGRLKQQNVDGFFRAAALL